MFKQTPLYLAVLAGMASVNVAAAPFTPLDARGLAMGSTGVATAKRAHAAAFNPALLTHQKESDDFALLLPQIGVRFADEDALIESSNDISDDIIPRFEDLFDEDRSDSFASSVNTVADRVDELQAAVDRVESALTPSELDSAVAELRIANTNFRNSRDGASNKLTEVNLATTDLDNALNSISDSPLSLRAGLGLSLALQREFFDIGLYAKADGNLSARARYSENDSNLITAYAPAIDEYLTTTQSVDTAIDALIDEYDQNRSVEQEDIDSAEAAAQSVENFTSSDSVTTADGEIKIFEGGELSPEAEDPTLDSQVQAVGLLLTEVGITLAREFNFGDNKVAIGITPKYQSAETYHYVTTVSEDDDENDSEEDNFELDNIEENSLSDSFFNIDVGAAIYLDTERKVRLGLVAKNLIATELEVPDAEVEGSRTNETVSADPIKLEPQLRVGVSYETSWLTLTTDLDLTENAPIAFESATQFAAIGAEFDLFDSAQLRLGYRTNLASGNGDSVTAGLGLSPFGIHLDLAVLANTNSVEQEVGVVLETGFYF